MEIIYRHKITNNEISLETIKKEENKVKYFSFCNYKVIIGKENILYEYVANEIPLSDDFEIILPYDHIFTYHDLVKIESALHHNCSYYDEEVIELTNKVESFKVDKYREENR